jgi:nucleotide-binding universal stress UspA family protein
MEKIVVGVDGSENAQPALEWAVAEAGLRVALMSPHAAPLANPIIPPSATTTDGHSGELDS